MNLGKAAVAGLAAWNYLINKRIQPDHYVAANLAATAAVLASGLQAATAPQLGLRLRRGLPAGLIAAAAVAGGSLIASKVSATGRLFDDQRVEADDVAYQAMVRIPLGTVVLEEIAFRSVLPALLDGAERDAPSAASAVLFGLWHIVPTLNTLDINDISDRDTRVKAVAAGVGTTAVAGWVFDKLRLRTGSVVTPMLAHWSANAVSYAIAAQRSRRQTEAPE